MQNTADRAKFWADFICNHCQFPSPEKLRQQFEHARLSEFCECGCNSFKVEVSPSAGALPIAQPGHYGMVFEANFRLQNEDKTIEVLLFAGKQGNLEYVEVDCCGNAYPVPEKIQVQEPPFHVHASPAIVL